MSEIKDKIQFRGLVISRIPSWARDYIKVRSKEEFSDDYGALISYLIKQASEYEQLKTKFLNSELPIKIGMEKEESKEEISLTKNGSKLNIKGGKRYG